MKIEKIDFSKLGGIVPAVVQDADTKAVLMVGFMNEEAVNKTIEDSKVTFYSRSKKRLWQKGEESGNFLEFVSIELDCDNDTLLVQARPAGPTCHKGSYSCFQSQINTNDFVAELFSLIKQRQSELPEGSYTTSLFNDGIEKIVAKVQEESGEVIQAASNETKERLAEESADLIYHLLVLLAEKDVDYSDVIRVLRKRNGKID